MHTLKNRNSLDMEGLRNFGPYMMMVVEIEGLDAHNRVVTLIFKDIKAKLFYQINGVNCMFLDSDK
ncbi:unnamed protein product [Arabidopsis halleri]